MIVSDRLRLLLSEGRLIRGSWGKTDADGRELLCLYTGLMGDRKARPVTCPASVAPKWLAHLMPWLDDEPSDAAWRPLMERIIAVANRLHLLPPETEWRVRALCVREAMRHTKARDTLAACDRVAALCERRGRGDAVPQFEFDEARNAAATAEAKAATAAATATAAAWSAAAAEAEAARAAVAWAVAVAAAEADAEAARAAVAGARAAAARARAAAAAVDRLADTIVGEIERTLAGGAT